RLSDLEREVRELRIRMQELEKQPAPVTPARLAKPVTATTPRPQRPPAARVVKEVAAPAPSLEDFLGGRLLGWVGGVAVCVGLALLFTLAIAHGWITE